MKKKSIQWESIKESIEFHIDISFFSVSFFYYVCLISYTFTSNFSYL
jgi:hypothetical protein